MLSIGSDIIHAITITHHLPLRLLCTQGKLNCWLCMCKCPILTPELVEEDASGRGITKLAVDRLNARTTRESVESVDLKSGV